MSVFGRFIGLILGLVLVGLAAWYAMTPQGILDQGDIGMRWLRTHPDLVLYGAIAVGVIGLILIVATLVPRRRLRYEATLEEGTVEYSQPAIGEMLERDLVGFDGIRDIHVRVAGSSRRVDARIDLLADDGTDARDLASRVQGRIRDRLERLGLASGNLRISLQQDRHVTNRRADFSAESDRRAA
jgi:hypothetical protein